MQTILSPNEILAGYDKVSILYPYVPPLSRWRAFEYAAYQKYQLSGRILDSAGGWALFSINLAGSYRSCWC